MTDEKQFTNGPQTREPYPRHDDPFSEGVRQTLAIIEDHWPEIDADVSDSTWLVCTCGWDSSVKGVVDWYQHLDNAVDEAIGVEARSQ